MNSRAIILAVVGALAALALVVFIALRNQRVLVDGLPPRVDCSGMVDARRLATAYAATYGGVVLPVLGTGSMAPYIPPAPAGKDSRRTTVAYVVTVDRATYSDIRPGTLCVYRPEFETTAFYLHSAAAEDGMGWIMSGLNNARSESWARVTPRNFVGIAAKTFTWHQ